MQQFLQNTKPTYHCVGCLKAISTSKYFNQQHHTTVTHSITFPTCGWCKLFLKTVLPSSDIVSLFTVLQHLFPPGFAKIDRTCQCSPKLRKIGITQCKINNQTTIRPSYSWMVFKSTKNGLHLYDFYLHCLYHCCDANQSHLNLSNPNS